MDFKRITRKSLSNIINYINNNKISIPVSIKAKLGLLINLFNRRLFNIQCLKLQNFHQEMTLFFNSIQCHDNLKLDWNKLELSLLKNGLFVM